MILEEHQGLTQLFTVNGQRHQTPYLTRVDPLSGNVSKISEQRARRSIGISCDIKIQPVEKCHFCAYKEKTPGERIEHPGGAISVPNKYPWEKYDWITIYPPFKPHKLRLSELCLDDLERMVESSVELATICAKDPEVIAFIDFTNWGAFAGASQQHPHSQRKSITHYPSPRIYMEMERCRQLMQRYERNPFDILEQEEAAIGSRVIHNDDIFIATAFAPTFPDEIIIFPKQEIAHILQTSEDDRRRIIKPILGIFPALFFYRGISSLNIAVHMADYFHMDEARKYYRWHMHIYPRRSRLPADRGGAEIGFNTNVIEVLPETTASLLRKWYSDGPKEELVAKDIKGNHDSTLLEDFRRFQTQNIPSGIMG